jgi:hypothetical protein
MRPIACSRRSTNEESPNGQPVRPCSRMSRSVSSRIALLSKPRQSATIANIGATRTNRSSRPDKCDLALLQGPSATSATRPRRSLPPAVLLPPFGLRPHSGSSTAETLNTHLYPLPNQYSHNAWYRKRGQAKAKECIGLAPLERVHDSKADESVAARLIQVVERELSGNPPRLAHALLVFQHAKQLLEREGGEPRVILAAAVLLPFMPDVPTGWDSTADGPTCLLASSTSAKQILQHVGFSGDTTRRVCHLIWAYRATKDRNTLELKIVSDADRLAQLAGQDHGITAEDLESVIQRDLHTSAGKQRARELSAQPSH